MWVPKPNACIEVLRLQSVETDPQTGSITFRGQAAEPYQYLAIQTWLGGFFSGANSLTIREPSQAPQQSPAEWMTWLFSYCRANPSKNLADAAETVYDLYIPKNTRR
jgi:hypothetical protein